MVCIGDSVVDKVREGVNANADRRRGSNFAETCGCHIRMVQLYPIKH